MSFYKKPPTKAEQAKKEVQEPLGKQKTLGNWKS